MSLIYSARRTFFDDVAEEVGPQGFRSIVLTHLLPDRPELLAAIQLIAEISLVIAIPYSIDQATLDSLSEAYPIATPSMDELLDPAAITRLIRPHLQKGRTVILEIGGYFAPFLQQLHDEFGERILGFIEDTENGHRKYLAAGDLPYPVVSVARSVLKQAEDALVGPSCVHSVERVLRSQGILIQGRRALVIGYGKVGRGAARALEGRGCSVSVYDSDWIRRSIAIAEGYRIPARDSALSEADLVLGCTGEQSISADDYLRLKSNAFLASCSSKRVEFDLSALAESRTEREVGPHIRAYEKEGHVINVLANGTPVNFVDGAVIGPALSLVQAEILFGIGQLVQKAVGSVSEVDAATRRAIAERWWATFCDERTGSYRQ